MNAVDITLPPRPPHPPRVEACITVKDLIDERFLYRCLFKLHTHLLLTSKYE